jgi:hypothetical protein
MSNFMLNQPLGYTQYSFRHDSIQKIYSLKRALYTLLLGRNTNSTISRGLQLAHLVGAVHVADQVDDTGAERTRGNASGFIYCNAHQRNSL